MRKRRSGPWWLVIVLLSLSGCIGTSQATTPTPESVAQPSIPAPPLATALIQSTPVSTISTPTTIPAAPTGTPIIQGTPAAVMAGLANPITVLAWSPNGTLLAGSCGSADATDTAIHLWRADGTVSATLTGHTKPVTALDWSPDGTTLASGSEDGTVRLWSDSGSLLHTIDLFHEKVFKVAWSPDGQLLAVASIAFARTFPGTVRLYTLGGQLQTTLSPTRLTGGKFFNLAWSADGSTLAGGAVDYALWRRDGTLIGSIELGGTPAWGTALSRDGSILALGDENGLLYLYDSSGKGIGTARFNSDVDSLAFAGLSHVLAVAAGSVNLVMAKPDATGNPVQGTIKPESNVAWPTSGRWLAAGAPDKTVRVWDNAGNPVRELSGCGGVPKVVAWSPDGHALVAATDTATLCLWHWQP